MSRPHWFNALQSARLRAETLNESLQFPQRLNLGIMNLDSVIRQGITHTHTHWLPGLVILGQEGRPVEAGPLGPVGSIHFHSGHEFAEVLFGMV